MSRSLGTAQPLYKYHFQSEDHSEAISCLSENGFCVIRCLIGERVIQALKDSIDEHLDQDRTLPLASNRYHVTFAEVCETLWSLVGNGPYWDFICAVHGTSNLCLHRSAAILRTAGESMGRWHSDFRGDIKNPRNVNEVLNRFPIPSGLWFYLNGSHPDRGGIAVIEKSHLPGWKPISYEFSPEGGIYRIGEDENKVCSDMNVPGCVAIRAEPGDLICFADRTYHANMTTNERRYSCGIGWRPKSYRVIAPWPLTKSAITMIDRLPERLKTYTEGYTGLDTNWKGIG